MQLRSFDYANYCQAKYHHGIELLQARYTRHSFAPHYHEAFAIGVVEEGALSNSFRCKFQGVVTQGEIISIFPGDVHTGRPVGDQGVAYRMMYLPSKIISEIFQVEFIEDEMIKQSFKKEKINNNQIHQFVCLHQILQDSERSQIEQECMLVSTLVRLFNSHNKYENPGRVRMENHRGIDIVRDYLCFNYSENITLNQLSAMASMSPYHFLRIFQKQVGSSPHAFQTQLRIEQAKRLIIQEERVTDVGVQVGFYDQSHFIKSFKSLVGVTPGKYLYQFK